MEEIVLLLIPILLAIVLLRLLVLPMKFIFKLLLHAAAGFVCLWLLNAVAPFTAILFPINAVTAAIAGLLGLPGIALLAILAII